MKSQAILATLRPRQWVKNAFVLAPLVFSQHLFELQYAWRSGLAVLLFCALSGAVYAFNDVRDVESDRRHPIKRDRPVASGALSESSALWLAGLLAAGALAAAFILSFLFALVALAYLVNNLAYSLALKRVAFVDVLMISAGFLLRILAGAIVIDVPVSSWLLACTALLSALLGFGKRAHELLMSKRAGTDKTETRSSLAGYDHPLLGISMTLLAISTCVAYAFYTVDPRTVAAFGSTHLLFTLPFCILGILRYAQLALWRPSRQSPTDAMLRDPLFLANITAWGVIVLLILY